MFERCYSKTPNINRFVKMLASSRAQANKK